MIVGIGVDVVDLARFSAALARTPAIRERLFTSAEAGLPVHSLAARFAAKEALAKCLRAPGGLRWTDAEIRVTDDGAPWLHLAGTVAAAADRLGVRSTHVSLSHDGGVAMALVVCET